MSRKICIVEDTPDLLENLVDFLSLEGYDVVSCVNGVEALEKLAHYTPDVIITDLWMPVMNGFELIDKIKANPAWRTIPIVVFSAAPLQASERESLNAQIDGFIIKPVNMENFLDAINEYFIK